MYAPALAALGSEKSTLASGSEESATAPWKLIQRPEPSTEPTVLAAKERLRSLLSSEAEHLPLLQRLEEAAEATAAMLDTLDGDMRLLVSTLGGEYTGPHLDAERMCKFFHRDGFSAEKIAAMYVCSTTGFVPPIKDRDETVDAQRLRAATAPQLPEHQAWAEKALLKDAAMLYSSHCVSSSGWSQARPSPPGTWCQRGRTSSGASTMQQQRATCLIARTALLTWTRCILCSSWAPLIGS